MISTLTDVDIANRMLAKFGGGSIQSFDEQSDLAGICSQVYPELRDRLLSIHPWRFVVQKRQVAKSAEVVPLNEWDNAFALPSSMLSGPHAVFGDGSSVPSQNYEIYGNYIYCNFNSVIVDYTRRPPESEWPPWFVAFMSTAGGAELAGPVADQISKGESLYQKAFGPPQMQGRGGMFAECRRLNAQNRPVGSLFQNGNPISAARFGGTSKLMGEVPDGN